ncbi:MAG: aminopeptidase P family protein [Bacteroidetes bacterium]|nr:aminopeptidase P family protein [Bacteroidota bacterium]
MNKEQLEFHKSRRDEFAKLMGDDSIAVIFGNTHINKSYDANYNFRQHKNFYYLTGFLEPDSVLMLSGGGIKYYDYDSKKESTSKEILFVQEKDETKETWTGVRLGKDNVKRELGIADAKENFDLPDFLNYSLFKGYKKLYINIADLISLTGELKEFTTQFLDGIRSLAPSLQILDSTYLLGKMRRRKTTYELKMMQAAADISANAFNDTLKKIKSGMKEYQVQANLEYNYKFNGSSDNAYPPICASGNHANILHYEENNDTLKEGELILIDSGAEYGYYCSDITRTYPNSGKFSKEQREIYEIVLDANKNCIKKSKEGASMDELKNYCDRFLADAMAAKGILKNKKLYKKYTIHGVGHHIGLDTHDAVPYRINKDMGDKLVVGDVITIEPGLYFPIGSRDVPKKYWGIGVRIEDDVVIGKNGCLNLTKNAVKEIDDIERLMAETRN